MAVTVLEKSDVDLLFGLDMLRRYRCNIDLENNCLKFGVLESTSLQFLPDHEIPNREPASAGACLLLFVCAQCQMVKNQESTLVF